MIGADKVSVTPEDLCSLRMVQQLRTVLESGDGENLVVHCAAGLHRTGIFLYLLLRELGDSPEAALEKIRQMREITYNEFKRLEFQAKADALFAVVGSTGSESARDAGRVVEIVSERATGEEEEIL